MAKDFDPISADERARIYNAAIANGTHSRTANHACQICGAWRPTYHVTIDHKGICLACAARSGVNGAKEHLAAEGVTR